MSLVSRARRAGLLAGLIACIGADCSAATAAPTAAPVLLVVGDSLSAEYGLARGSGWVALLAERLKAQKSPLQVVNASISGDTTAGGRSRLPALLTQHKPALVVIELGGNDALRGLPVTSTRDNLMAMTSAAQQAGAKVLLVGMQVPPNYGRAYTEDFARSFQQVARERRAGLVPFLLAGVADRPDAEAWFQSDRIHPLAKAHPLMLDNVWPVLKTLLPR
ncbi:arylesterase [Ideonella sp. 4Y11]|uniref:Arylesterase n=1 Tax=Ideonella aquatica TaxID=2824119 RepID=A0A940YLE4_9BURK|nr:arylesterase [Ideonella aquatica]MBQ0960782.1 arylesterase [Ideonella aquatica]